MKSAELFAELLKKGASAENAFSSLPPYEPQYFAGVPIEIYRAAEQLGWCFFPAPRTERQARYQSFFHEATSDLEKLKRWARNRPNWGLATGSISGVLVLAVDREEGTQSLLTLCGDDWDWLDTLRTEAGPLRFIFFAWPGEHRQISNAAHIGEGLRVLADGDWLLFPPSREVNGNVHYFLNPRLAVIDTPPWLLDRILPRECEKGRPSSFPSTVIVTHSNAATRWKKLSSAEAGSDRCTSRESFGLKTFGSSDMEKATGFTLGCEME